MTEKILTSKIINTTNIKNKINCNLKTIIIRDIKDFKTISILSKNVKI